MLYAFYERYLVRDKKKCGQKLPILSPLAIFQQQFLLRIMKNKYAYPHSIHVTPHSRNCFKK